MKTRRTAAMLCCLLTVVALGSHPVRLLRAAQADIDPAAVQDEEKQELREAIERARGVAERLFYDVRVSFKEFQPSAVREGDQHFGYGAANSRAMALSLDKRALVLDAVLVDPERGLFLMADPNLNFDMVEGMTLCVPGGDELPFHRVAVCSGQSAVLMQAEGFAADVAMPPLVEAAVEDGEDVLVARVTRFGDLRDIQVSPVSLGTYLRHGDSLEILGPGGGRPQSQAQSYSQLDEWSSSNRLLFTMDGELAAVLVSSMLITVDGRRNYFVDWPSVEGNVTVEGLQALAREAVSRVDRHTYRVKVHFRSDENRYSSRYSSYYEEDAPTDEWVTYGLAVDGEHLFVPFELERQKIETIESIKVQLKSGQEVAGAFTGVFEEFAGILIECSEPVEPPPNLWAERDIPEGNLFVDVSLKQRFGAKDALPKYNRFFGTQKGYKDKPFRQPQRPVLSGSWLLDADGGLYGFATMEKRYESVDLRRMPGGYRYWAGRESDRCFTFADMKDRFLQPDEHLDATVRVKDIQERKELAWLGVESQPVTPDLARELHLEKETRDGRFGLLVSLVYAASPAARMGVEPGDVLLTLKVEGKAGEHLLTGQSDYRYYSSWEFSDYMDAPMPDMPYVQREWFNRRNALTQLLTTIGLGKKATLSFRHGDEVKSADFVIEKAPPDLDSADKFKDEWTGLTVKDITYEVRRVLRLEPGYEAVIVYEVEPGSTAAVGQITPMEFVEEINGQKVTDIELFEEFIGRLVEEGTKSATFKVRNLDESRFVDVELEKREQRVPALGRILEQIPGLVPE